MTRGVSTEQEIRQWSFSDRYLSLSKNDRALSGMRWVVGDRSWWEEELWETCSALLWHYLRKQEPQCAICINYTLNYKENKTQDAMQSKINNCIKKVFYSTYIHYYHSKLSMITAFLKFIYHGFHLLFYLSVFTCTVLVLDLSVQYTVDSFVLMFCCLSLSKIHCTSQFWTSPVTSFAWIWIRLV